MKYTDDEKKVRSAARKIQKAILFEGISDSIPWRKDKTPYRIFLAEFLLVRTRADVVARCFNNITNYYPDIGSLAHAKEDLLAKQLAPLGLRKRVPVLLSAARYILDNFEGVIPHQFELLVRIPGFGPYTAAAVAAFAFESSDVPADVNILRFLSRLTGKKMTHPTKGSDELRQLLRHLSRNNSGLLAEKLLDFTRLICQPVRPKCVDCPVKKNCSYRLGTDK
jgi:A/G-specific adenine glycosylase